MSPSDLGVSLVDATILDGATASAIIDLPNGVFPVGIYFPAIDTSTAFNFNVAGQPSDSVVAMQKSGSAYAVTISAGVAGYVPLVTDEMKGIKRIQLSVANAQTGDKAIKLAVRTI